jgi:hypothetical protein
LSTTISLCTIRRFLLTSFPAPRKKKEGRKKEKARKKGNRKKYHDLEGVAFPSSLSHGRAGLGSSHRYSRPPTKTHEAWVYSTAELEVSHVPEGYMVSFMSFYERGFNMPPHQFIHSLLQYYSLDLCHLTPSGVLHIVAFMTLSEAYLGIDPKLDLWKYFFHVWHS